MCSSVHRSCERSMPSSNTSLLFGRWPTTAECSGSPGGFLYGGLSCQGRIKENQCGISLRPPVSLSRSCGEPHFPRSSGHPRMLTTLCPKKPEFSCSSQDCQVTQNHRCTYPRRQSPCDGYRLCTFRIVEGV